MARLQGSSEVRGASGTTSTAQNFQGSKEATDCNPHVGSGDKNSESFAAWMVELQNWVGSLQDNMLKVMEVAESREGRHTELDVRNAGTSPETVDDVRELDRRLASAHCFARKEKRRTTFATLKDLDSKRGSRWSVASIRGPTRTGLLHARE